MDTSLYNKEIIEKFKEKSSNLLKESIEDFLKKNETELNKMLSKLIGPDNNLALMDFKNLNNKTKKRWFDAEINGKASGLKEVKVGIKKAFEEVKNEEDLIHFKGLYRKDTPEDAIEEKIRELEMWKNGDTLFTDFPYVFKKSSRAIKSGLLKDIIVCILKIKENHDKKYVSIPDILIPEDTTSRIKVNSKNSISTKDNKQIKELYCNKKTGEEISLIIDKNKYMSQMMDGKIEKTDLAIMEEIEKKLKVFNPLHGDLIRYICNQTEAIYKGERIERSLSSILAALDKPNNKSNRDAVVDALYYLGSADYKRDGEFIGGFISVKITPVEIKRKAEAPNGKKKYEKKVKIYLDGMLRDVLLMDRTFNFYADKFSLLSRDAQQILIGFQSERILRVLNNDESLTSVKTFEDFRRYIYFSSKRVVKPRVLAALAELKKYKMGVKEYKQINPYEVEIEFFKFQDKDLKLIKQDDFKYGNLIEGSYEIKEDE